MKKEIIVITDIWGMNNSEWIEQYVLSLKSNYNVSIIDSHKLGLINASNLSEKAIYEQFINGGIDRAVEKLVNQIPSVYSVIGFSIGGLIAWRACLQGFKVETLIAVSSTRLRYEKVKPDCNIFLIYGQEDKLKPDKNWFKTLNVNHAIIERQEHELYKDSKIVLHLLQNLKSIL